MTIYVNQKPYECVAENIAELHQELGLQQMVAIALNNRVVPQREWNSTPIKPEDRLVIVSIACGG